MELFFQEFVEAFQEMGEEAFRQKFNHPYLLFPDKHGTGDLKSYHTRMATRDDDVNLSGSGKKIKEFRVLVPAKHRSSLSEKLLVGRGEDRDLAIDHSTVSKRHAFLLFDAESSNWKLGDAGSTNGTFLNGQRLESSNPVAVKDGNIVSFGDCDYLFMSPGGFVELLKKLAEVED